MVRCLLDSDTVSELLKGRNPVVARNAQKYLSSFPQLSFTSATVLEVLYGLERIGATAQIQRAESLFKENDEIVPEPGDYRLAAKIAADLDRQGTRIGLLDPLIASCAIRRDYLVVSGNTEHFQFILRAGYHFRLENWRDV